MLRPIRPAAPIRIKYEQRLTSLIDEMHRSLMHWIAAEWRKNTPETVLYGADELPAKALQSAMNTMSRRWLKRFDSLADSLAAYFSTATRARCDRTLADDLRKGGFTVKFRMTPAMRDAFEAVRAENVSLIKSIAEQHLGQVEQAVMRSVSAGRDLASLNTSLLKIQGVTKRRAAFIARDQNNKSTAVLTRARHIELGITQAKWLHSAGGKHPRPEHVAFSGKIYDIREGHDFGDGNGKTLPGVQISCRCVAVPVVPGFD
jgi:uncharacterized protein with gpF-like domain